MSRTDPSRTRTSPQDVRRKNFTVRFRGLNPDEVRYFFAGLANDLEGILAQVASTRPALAGGVGRRPLVAGEVQDVAEALGGDDADPRAGGRQHRVGGDGRAVSDLGQRARVGQAGDAVDHGLRGIVRRRRQLLDGQRARHGPA